MEHKKIVIPSLSFFQNELKGEGVVKSRRTLGELAGIFENQDAYSQLPLDQLAYEVYSYLPEREGTPGGLYFSIFPNNYEILSLFSIQALLIFFLVLGWKHIRGFLKLADEVG